MPKEEKITKLHKIPDINPKIRQKGTLNILISKKYFEIALLYILCNKFHFGYGFHILPNLFIYPTLLGLSVNLIGYSRWLYVFLV